MPVSIHNPEFDATVDTTVHGKHYVITPGQTLEDVPDRDAQNLLQRYGFLQEVVSQMPSEPADVAAVAGGLTPGADQTEATDETEESAPEKTPAELRAEAKAAKEAEKQAAKDAKTQAKADAKAAKEAKKKKK